MTPRPNRVRQHRVHDYMQVRRRWSRKHTISRTYGGYHMFWAFQWPSTTADTDLSPQTDGGAWARHAPPTPTTHRAPSMRSQTRARSRGGCRRTGRAEFTQKTGSPCVRSDNVPPRARRVRAATTSTVVMRAMYMSLPAAEGRGHSATQILSRVRSVSPGTTVHKISRHYRRSSMIVSETGLPCT